MRYDGRGAVIRPDILRAAAAIPCVTTAVARWSGRTSSAAG